MNPFEMLRCPESQSWIMIAIGILGYLLSQRGAGLGISFDLLTTALDTMRTLAMIGIIVFGSFMLLNEFKAPAPAACPVVREASTVTIPVQQFKTLLALASSNQRLNLAVTSEEANLPAVSKVSAESVAPNTPAAPAVPTEPAAANVLVEPDATVEPEK